MTKVTAYPYIIQGDNIVIIIDNKPHNVSKSHMAYTKIRDAIKVGDWETVKANIDVKKTITTYSQGNVTIVDGAILWNGVPMHNAMTARMTEMLREGFDITPLVNFMTNLMSNPSNRAVNELYGFLEKSNLPITPDGHFLAYKKVRENYMDVHSGTFDNSVGKVCEMERNMVDDDKDRTCSAGLHFCSVSYLSHFGGDRIVIVKINPRDVVSIPSDYNDSKGRACRYEVVGELENEVKSKPETAFTKPVHAPQAAWPMPPAKTAPVVATGPKVGTSDYTRGYTDGYLGVRSQYVNYTYNDGYAAGADDKRNGAAMKYRFATAAPVITAAQDYDKNGNPLSMTKDAIRKRKARAAKASAAKTAPKQYRNNGWTV